MNATELLERHFGKMGARVQVNEAGHAGFGIDIGTDKRGEYFDVQVPRGAEPEMHALQIRPDLRHLLLFVRGEGVGQNKYLCGHDERHWFVAGVNDTATTVENAMRSLRPTGVPEASLRRVRAKDRLKRRNEAFVRQGEWFFVPTPQLRPPASLILSHEPLSRGDGGKPHWCEELYRDGGTPVYVCDKFPRGVSVERYERLLEQKSGAQSWNWRLMRLNANVYARGKVSHPDHATITLPFWHWVAMNSEHRRGVVFLD